MEENDIQKNVWEAINSLRFSTKIGENARRAE